MITFQGATEFWIRHDRQNARMSIAEIRAATRATEDLVAKVDQALHDGIVAPLDEDPGWTAARIAERFWNAFRYPACPFFTAEGQLALGPR